MAKLLPLNRNNVKGFDQSVLAGTGNSTSLINSGENVYWGKKSDKSANYSVWSRRTVTWVIKQSELFWKVNFWILFIYIVKSSWLLLFALKIHSTMWSRERVSSKTDKEISALCAVRRKTSFGKDSHLSANLKGGVPESSESLLSGASSMSSSDISISSSLRIPISSSLWMFLISCEREEGNI